MIDERPADAERPEALVLRQHQSGAVEVLEAPPLSSITVELLVELDPVWLDPATPDVLVLPGGFRYRLGGFRPPPHEHERLLHRLDTPLQPEGDPEC